MTVTNIGEDDGSGDIGADSSSGSSDNSSFIRNHSCKTSIPSRNSKQIKSQRLMVQDAKPINKNDAMAGQFLGCNTLKSESRGDNISATSWISNVEKWNQEAQQLLSPRGCTRIKKPISCPNRSPRLNVNLPFGLEESGNNSETSISSYSSTCGSDNLASTVANPTRSSSCSAPNQWELQLAVLKQSRKAREELPLLQLYTQSSETDIESGFLLSKTEIESDVHPDIKTEVRKLFALAYPVTFTSVLEFFPQLVSMALVGHLDSPLTKQYLDGVALSTMCVNLTAIGVEFGSATAMDTLYSQAYGAGKPKKLGIYLQSGLIVLGLATIPVFIINWHKEAFLVMMTSTSAVNGASPVSPAGAAPTAAVPHDPAPSDMPCRLGSLVSSQCSMCLITKARTSGG
ncbi:unnamed protein product [Peronospora destructor]|uniref:Uncharacterized protein n=1 Tax=Peronospora destructor TaxID=86335 RepID=A0AAV0SYF2_9STRA|nr:unnamed protein product [Peronospora destructor]